MAEIEISTTGELKFCDTTVGQIAWVKPFCETEVAGRYDDMARDYSGAFYGCSSCADKDGDIDDLEDDVSDLEDERDALKGKLEAALKRIAVLEGQSQTAAVA